MKLKNFSSMSFDYDTKQSVGVRFATDGGQEWGHAVYVPTNASPETVAKALRLLASAIEKGHLPVDNWWEK